MFKPTGTQMSQELQFPRPSRTTCKSGVNMAMPAPQLRILEPQLGPWKPPPTSGQC